MGNQRYLQSVYEELHAHPELPLEEVWTAGFVADELRGMGFSVSTQVGVKAWRACWVLAVAGRLWPCVVIWTPCPSRKNRARILLPKIPV